MPREKWEEIVAYYRTYIGIIHPMFKECRSIFLKLDPLQIQDPIVLGEILTEESKRSLGKVKAISEFSAALRAQIFEIVQNYVEEVKDQFDPHDLKDYIIDFFDEAIEAGEALFGLVELDSHKHEDSLLYKMNSLLAEILLPTGNTLEEIYGKLIEQKVTWYEAQRYILRPSTYYREEIGDMSIPGLSPKMYQIINNITSLFNLDPNYIDLPENPSQVIPAIMKSDVFEPYIDQIANAEEEAIKRIGDRLELRIIDDLFLAPTEFFIKIVAPHNFLRNQKDTDGKTRWLPQFSNETLILLYLAYVSFRRGFLSKELINWIAMNFAFIIYNTILHWKMSLENIFYGLFLDLKTEEKLLPYLMKLLCFDKYLRMDYMKIRDSPSYRKEVFTFLGSKIEAIDKLTYFLVNQLKEEEKIED